MARYRQTPSAEFQENERNKIIKAGGKPLKILKNYHVQKDYSVLADGMIGAHKDLPYLKTSIELTTKPKGD